MNINLSAVSKKKKGGSNNNNNTIGFGLNKRKKTTPTNVFDGDDNDDDDDDDDSGSDTAAADGKKSRRDIVNREIAAEQAALRKRAMQTMASLGTAAADGENLYDYDRAYDSFPKKTDTNNNKEEEEAIKAPEERKSRYIQDLLKQSEKRAIEREAIYERKVAKEQAEEDAQADYKGKEKFVTKAYQLKLEERRRLEAEEDLQQKVDARQDVTKKTGGAAFANFYGNLSRNVAMGGGIVNKANHPNEDAGNGSTSSGAVESSQTDANNQKKEALAAAELGFMDGFERGAGSGSGPQRDQSNVSKEEAALPKGMEVDPVAKLLAMRKAREKKLVQARIRYFQRNGMPVEGVS